MPISKLFQLYRGKISFVDEGNLSSRSEWVSKLLLFDPYVNIVSQL